MNSVPLSDGSATIKNPRVRVTWTGPGGAVIAAQWEPAVALLLQADGSIRIVLKGDGEGREDSPMRDLAQSYADSGNPDALAALADAAMRSVHRPGLGEGEEERNSAKEATHLLAEFQWSDGGRCPCCGREKSRTAHDPSCRIAASLARAGYRVMTSQNF